MFYIICTSDFSEILHARYFLEPFSLPDLQSTEEHGAGRQIMLLHRTAFENINYCRLQLSYCRGQVTHMDYTTPLFNKLTLQSQPFSKEQSSRPLPTPCSQHCPI